MPKFNLQDFFTKSSPSVKDLEPDLLNLTDSERKVILTVMQKDLVLKGVQNNQENHEVLNDWLLQSKIKTVSKKEPLECESCGKRHCHCDTEKNKALTLKTKRKRLKSLRSPSVEYALELSKQILHSPLSPCHDSSTTASTGKKSSQNPASDTNHLTVKKDKMLKRKRGTLKSSKAS